MTGPQHDQPRQEQPSQAPRHAAVPIDFTAALAAMQDQIDDLTATVAALHERLERLDPSEHSTQPGAQSDGR